MNVRAIILSSIGLAALAGLALSGPLNPGAGPVASTFKTLTEIEPRTAINPANTPGDANSVFKITSPGSYYLPANVYMVPGKHGVEIEADDVTIDLNGFRIGGFDGSLSGIANSGARRNITVVNGVLEHCSEYGINFWNTGAPANGCRIQDILVQDCGQGGVRTGPAAIIRDVVARNNTGVGISADTCSVIDGCIASSNTTFGIGAGARSTVTGCAADANGATGIKGYGSTIQGCTASGNGQGGFECAEGIVRGCTAQNNTGGAGIRGGISTRIEGCCVTGNERDGILAYIRCTITGNTCTGNGSGPTDANISAFDGSSVVENNVCRAGSVGIKITGSRSVIVRNICGANTLNWSIDANNSFGPIIDRSSAVSGAVSGASAAGTMGTTDPNANFTE